MKDAFGVSKGQLRSTPKQYRKAEARKAGQRLRLKATGHHVGSTPSLVKPPMWKRPGYQLAAGAIVAGALGGTMYSYQKGKKQAELSNPAPAMPTGQYGRVIKSESSDRKWHGAMAAGNAAMGTAVGAHTLKNFKTNSKLGNTVGGTWAGMSAILAAREASLARKKKVKVAKAGFTSAPGFAEDVIRVGKKGKYLLKRKPKPQAPLGFHPEPRFKVSSSGEVSPAKNRPKQSEYPGSYAVHGVAEKAPEVTARLSAKARVKKGLNPYGYIKGVGKVKINHPVGKTHFDVTDSKDARRLVPRERLIHMKNKPLPRKPKWEQGELFKGMRLPSGSR